MQLSLKRATRSVLMWRELLAVTRNPTDVAGRMLIFAYISSLLGAFLGFFIIGF